MGAAGAAGPKHESKCCACQSSAVRAKANFVEPAAAAAAAGARFDEVVESLHDAVQDQYWQLMGAGIEEVKRQAGLA